MRQASCIPCKVSRKRFLVVNYSEVLESLINTKDLNFSLANLPLNPASY